MLTLKKIFSMKNKMKINLLWIASNMQNKNLVLKCKLQSNFHLMAILQSNMILILIFKLKLMLRYFRIWRSLMGQEYVISKIKNVEMDSLKKKKRTQIHLSSHKNQKRQNYYIKRKVLMVLEVQQGLLSLTL